MAATTVQTTSVENTNNLVHTVQVGVIAGLVGGSVFGVQMAAMEMLPMIAGMVGSTSVVVGFVLHIIISAVIGGSFGLIASRLGNNLFVQVGAGLVWGIVWWILGALIIMPLVMGMAEMVLQVGDMQLMSLVGHAFFGIILGAFYALFNK